MFLCIIIICTVLPSWQIKIYRVGQKTGPQTHNHNSVKFLPIYTFFHREIHDKFAVKCIFKIPPHIAYVVTLPCETIMSAKKAINDKLQGSVVA